MIQIRFLENEKKMSMLYLYHDMRLDEYCAT